ncbi:MAG: MazG-like family protein [Bacillota bacterium]
MNDFNPKDKSITKNLKVIEWLKTELLGNVSSLFKLMIRRQEEKILVLLANIVMSAYLLAKRLGYSFEQLNRQVEDRLKDNIRTQHEIENWYGELSELLEHFEKRG